MTVSTIMILKVLKRIEKTEEYQQDPDLQAWVKLNESVTYGIMGLYHSADNLTASIDPSELSREEQLHYYLTYRYNYERIAEYMAEISIIQDEEKQMVTLYDKILELVPEGYETSSQPTRRSISISPRKP